jgi:small subunit ribosomal protein S6
MNKYEIVYIFRSTLTSEELESKLQNFHAQLTRNAGQISAVEHWGKRQLAYPIDKERNGNYVVAQFETEPASLPDFERLLKLDDQILRYLIVLSEGELPIPPSMRRESDDRPGYRAAAPGSPGPAEGESEDDTVEGEEAGEPAAADKAGSELETTSEEGPEEPVEEERSPSDSVSDEEGLAVPADGAGDPSEEEERSSSDG